MNKPGPVMDLLTLEEAMTFLRISRSTMYRLIKRGELPGYKIANKWMFATADLSAFVAQRRMPQDFKRALHAHHTKS